MKIINFQFKLLNFLYLCSTHSFVPIISIVNDNVKLEVDFVIQSILILEHFHTLSNCFHNNTYVHVLKYTSNRDPYYIK